jgi:hypothetical protein
MEKQTAQFNLFTKTEYFCDWCGKRIDIKWAYQTIAHGHNEIHAHIECTQKMIMLYNKYERQKKAAGLFPGPFGQWAYHECETRRKNEAQGSK